MELPPRSRGNRRRFLQAALGTGVTLLAPSLSLSARRSRRALHFAAIADVHHGLAPDASARLGKFVDAVQARDHLDFALQLGDFCHPTEAARPFLEQWSRITVPRHHVLGNHDMDKGTKDDAVRAWKMHAPWYSFDAGGWHFIILDLNHLREEERRIDYAHANFYVPGERRAWAHPEQLAWLRSDLKRAGKPSVVFSHQPLGLYSGPQPPPQQSEVLEVLAEGPELGSPVLACLCGHLHVDRHRVWKGMHCVCINSASYHWAGGMYPYEDALFAFVDIAADGTLRIHGRKSKFRGEHPHEAGSNEEVEGVAAQISDRALERDVER